MVRSKKLKNKNKKNKSRRKFRMKLRSRKRSAPHSSVSVKRQKSKTCPKIILSGIDNFHLLEAMNNPLNPIESWDGVEGQSVEGILSKAFVTLIYAKMWWYINPQMISEMILGRDVHAYDELPFPEDEPMVKC